MLTNGRVVGADKAATAVSLDGQPATLDALHAGAMVTVRADPKSGKVRDVVALSPANPGSAAGAATCNRTICTSTPLKTTRIMALRAGQMLRVQATGTRGASVVFDIGDLVGGIPMPETQAGRYEGAFNIQVGTNFINAPIV